MIILLRTCLLLWLACGVVGTIMHITCCIKEHEFDHNDVGAIIIIIVTGPWGLWQVISALWEVGI